MRSLVVGLLLASAFALTGCGDQDNADESSGGAVEAPSQESTDAESPVADEPTSADPTGGDEVKVAETLRFTGTTVEGEPFDGASLAGKPAVLWFWAPWCPTCKGQIPNVSALAEQYSGEVNIVGVAGLSDDAAGIEAFAANTSGITNLTDSPGELWRRFGIVEQSVFTVLDRNGEIVSEGYLEDDELNELVADLAG